MIKQPDLKATHRSGWRVGFRGLAAGVAALVCVAAPALASARTVVLAMKVKLDEVSKDDAAMYRVGGYDLDRIAYDDTKVDPVTHRVRLAYLAHYIGGHWFPVEDLNASSLNVDTYRIDYAAPLTHGREIVALFVSDGRMAMLSRPDFRMLIAGVYTIDPRPLTAAEIAAPPPGANGPDVMPMMSGMPKIGPGAHLPEGAPPR